MDDRREDLNRRKVLAGAGTAGVLAAGAALVPLAGREPAAASATVPAPAQGGGYRVTQHVLQYYQTARV